MKKKATKKKATKKKATKKKATKKRATKKKATKKKATKKKAASATGDATAAERIKTYLKEKPVRPLRPGTLPKPGHYPSGRGLLRSDPATLLELFHEAQARLRPGLTTQQRGKLQSLCDSLLTKSLPLTGDELAAYATARAHGQPHWGWNPLVDAVESLNRAPTPKLTKALRGVWEMLEWNWSYRATAARIEALL